MSLKKQGYVYNYRDGSNIKYKGTPYNTAGWTTVVVVGQIIEKIGPILATKYSEALLTHVSKRFFFKYR